MRRVGRGPAGLAVVPFRPAPRVAVAFVFAGVARLVAAGFAFEAALAALAAFVSGVAAAAACMSGDVARVAALATVVSPAVARSLLDQAADSISEPVGCHGRWHST